ncbi:MAG TPA: aspartyl protease family protein [Anaeromyxobacteraceae bacterium]|nr:aspartyl protease family protein [Anaeromyxobacteraceae bacterium]
MRSLAIRILLALAALTADSPVRADSTANAVLAKAKAASGGEAWNGIRTMRARAKVNTGGLSGSGESIDDLVHGWFLDRFALGPVTGAQGFDGKTAWTMDASKQVHEEEGGDARLAAVDDGYRRRLAYWFPERGAARIELSGDATEGSRRFRVLTLSPEGGRPFALWIDASTHLVDRVVEKAALETRTTFYSDYRSVGGVKLPFRSRSTNGEPKYDQTAEIVEVTFNEPVAPELFAMPAPPPPDFSIAGGKTSTSVPFALVNNHIYVDVRLDGRGPFRMLCDTGGMNILTPSLAKALGLKAEGALEGRGVGDRSEDVALAKVGSLRVGDATLRDQVFAVFPLDTFEKVEGLRISGIIGYEVFRRFVVEVNYEERRLGLTLPKDFEYRGRGVAVPFQYNDKIPQVEGSIDGIPGKFDIDTGSRSTVDLTSPFVEKNDLKRKYPLSAVVVTGWGVGGPARSYVTRGKELRIGTVVVRAPVLLLSAQDKGAFSDPYLAGNVGGGVLKRFNITFDYGHKRLYLEANANDAAPDTFDRAGMWVNVDESGFAVVDVMADGPADRAGVRAGDSIVAVGSTAASQMSLADFRSMLRTLKPGTEVRLTVQSGGKRREVVLVLRDVA